MNERESAAFADARAEDCRDAAAELNRGCLCASVDRERLRIALEGEVGRGSGLSLAALQATHPHLFSDTQVFVATAHLRAMSAVIAAIERLVARPAWQTRVLAHAPAIARHCPRAAGVFLGYDFHLGDEGPRLIEINTNAGGAMLNACLLRAQLACCRGGPKMPPDDPEARFLAMFREEWARSGGQRPLHRVAIVDDSPETQYLAPEFALFARLFERAGIEARIAPPEALQFDGQSLKHDGAPIDLVYNRLTDFDLSAPGHEALRAAYLADAVVLTPHPRAHALYADKRNLVALCDQAWLAEIGVSEEDRAVLAAGVPQTEIVDPLSAADFWATRKRWFFKPAAGYGSRATYRGDKLTRRVFETIAGGDYVAQALVPPSERRLRRDGEAVDLKLDLRCYAYRADVQLVSARLYQGQTTNFRTPGGGFSAVIPVACTGERGDRE